MGVAGEALDAIAGEAARLTPQGPQDVDLEDRFETDLSVGDSKIAVPDGDSGDREPLTTPTAGHFSNLLRSRRPQRHERDKMT